MRGTGVLARVASPLHNFPLIGGSLVRWECRYSSCEMMYLEVTPSDVRCYLDHSVDSADVWTFEQAVAGEADRALANIFPDSEIAEMKAEARVRLEARRV